MITTEAVIVLACFLGLSVFGASYEKVLPALFVVGLLFPVVFYHHSWSLWLGFDFIVESLPKYQPAKHKEP